MKKKYLFLLLCCCMLSWNTQKSNVFLIGDSMSIEYGPYLKEYISDYAIMERKQDDGETFKNLDVPMGSNGGDSRMVLAYLESKVKNSEFKPDYILINCGLHDIKRNLETNKIQIGEDEYRENLTKIFQLLSEGNSKPIWINTTWVIDEVHNARSKAFSRYNADVIKYNEIASEICNQYHVPVVDLYTFSEALGKDQIRDHVHYTSNAQALQAAYVAGFI